ncbi:hypothetical protein JQ99_004993, partial [Salmonella enterica subsp. enterica]|nr:hypothetical protein [Salmonella enterica subsp. enterica]
RYYPQGFISLTPDSPDGGMLETINILRHSRRFFRCACKALLPAAP